MFRPEFSRKVAYFYDDEIGNFYYGAGHPMKTHRIRMAHHLILNYGLYKKMEIYRPAQVSPQDMTTFHADDYVHFLQHINPENVLEFGRELAKYNLDVDCPVFDGLFKFCQYSVGGTLGGAYKINRQTSDIVLNWSGGLHHAKKAEASGFCYVNDIVVAILELLKCHTRVLYCDIDIHHGDGVEEAFYATDRVMTLSFHKYGEYFPGTGHPDDIGVDNGKGYSLNFPLKDGMDDESYETVFKPVMNMVLSHYQPTAIIMQCGADSLTGDRLGSFNLSLHGHGMCVDYVKSFNIPMIVVGGGGYTLRNVSRCWALETAICLDTTISNDIPYNQYYEYYGPDFKLHINPTNMENQNSKEYLEKHKIAIFELLKGLPHCPSVPFINTPHDIVNEVTEVNPDVKISKRDMPQDEREFYDDDEDQDH